jgi:hypothetical protein
VIAAGNWTDHVYAPSVPKGRATLVWSESDISEAVDKVKESNYSKLFVVGKRELALQIVDALEAEGITPDHIVGVPTEVSRQIRNALNATISELKTNWAANITRIMNAIRDNWASIVNRCNQTIHQFRAINAVVPTVVEETVTDAISAYQSQNYIEAMRKCYQLIEEKNKLVWRYRNILNKTEDDLISEESTKVNNTSIDTGLRSLYARITNAPSIHSVAAINPSAISGKSQQCILAIQSAKALYQQEKYILAKEAFDAATRLCQ